MLLGFGFTNNEREDDLLLVTEVLEGVMVEGGQELLSEHKALFC